MEKITSELLAEYDVAHGFYSRYGGVSPSPWDTLNVSVGVGDDLENVRRNRCLLADDLGLTTLMVMDQVHSSRVQVVDAENDTRETVEASDAMVTGRPGVGLLVQHADCQPVLLADPVQKVVAAVHNGWRGAVLNILEHTVQVMVQQYGSEPKKIIAAIGPAIGPCCAEFDGYKELLPNAFQAYKVKENFFDFLAVSRDQLKGCGLLGKNIETIHECTVCSRNFFSHRRDGNKSKGTGRNGSIIALLQ